MLLRNVGIAILDHLSGPAHPVLDASARGARIPTTDSYEITLISQHLVNILIHEGLYHLYYF